MYRITVPVINMLPKPDSSVQIDTQLLYGETVTLLSEEATNGYLHVKADYDDYEGYILADHISETADPATHYVATRTTLLFTESHIKTPNPVRLSLGAQLTVTEMRDDRFFVTDTGLYGITSHILPIGTPIDHDFVTIAEMQFLGSPYIWGAKSSDGIDCSGLVQLSAKCSGLYVPRDSGPQERYLETDGDINNLLRGDLIYWPGHVGIMTDDTHLLHANAHHMKTVKEPLKDVIARAENEVRSVKRIKKPA